MVGWIAFSPEKQVCKSVICFNTFIEFLVLPCTDPKYHTTADWFPMPKAPKKFPYSFQTPKTEFLDP